MAGEDNVILFNGITKLDLPADRILDAASKRGLANVVVIGYDENGEEYFASSFADGGTVIWLMERCKLKLLQIADEYRERSAS